jgi:hypothetical protein
MSPPDDTPTNEEQFGDRFKFRAGATFEWASGMSNQSSSHQSSKAILPLMNSNCLPASMARRAALMDSGAIWRSIQISRWRDF